MRVAVLSASKNLSTTLSALGQYELLRAELYCLICERFFWHTSHKCNTPCYCCSLLKFIPQHACAQFTFPRPQSTWPPRLPLCACWFLKAHRHRPHGRWETSLHRCVCVYVCMCMYELTLITKHVWRRAISERPCTRLC